MAFAVTCSWCVMAACRNMSVGGWYIMWTLCCCFYGIILLYGQLNTPEISISGSPCIEHTV
ncbi:hypothetical protein L226DRAFT_305056 [Lentinus tigrinus ALCF2SS1-7]|uniref:Uncharacterized protein n=1 Tax=Lentinus tigrinus ALCF2SS1-6 TaxID=1328759 RepID=A0A5C2RU92_9APHY|nr:hypothetical protein L227DRAFT_355141 [Lentinus tigrinus ALCF2SS1-6]RPD69201.1 hypothetical protein L226DRAFT_305056 [Lentinus tigrinus ALCF2SS1-7]